MAVRRDRDLERTYSRAQFVAKLRRLADALEAEQPFNIQVAGERLRIPADVAFSVEHERADGVDELEFQLRYPSYVPLPAGLSAPARRALAGAGYVRLEQLISASEAELIRLHGMGPRAMSTLRTALAARGWTFAGGD